MNAQQTKHINGIINSLQQRLLHCGKWSIQCNRGVLIADDFEYGMIDAASTRGETIIIRIDGGAEDESKLGLEYMIRSQPESTEQLPDLLVADQG